MGKTKSKTKKAASTSPSGSGETGKTPRTTIIAVSVVVVAAVAAAFFGGSSIGKPAPLSTDQKLASSLAAKLVVVNDVKVINAVNMYKGR